jgi:outer membrane protein assembly factor BamB
MKSYPSMRRFFLFGLTAAIFGGVMLAFHRSGADPDRVLAQQAQKLARVWPMFGGTPDRNMVCLTEKNIPAEWSVEEKSSIKWAAKLGSRAYGGPVIAGGKIFVGTNNNFPRNPKVKGDKGIIMCFRESDGQFLWQAIHDKLPSGQVHDWPQEGICSTPLVEGNRVYYVSNRCEVVCADTEGFLDGSNDGVQDEKYTDKTDADIIWRLDMMKELNVFPHNMAACSPVLAGDLLFIVTANGVDEGHINIPNPQAPSFIAVNKKTGQVVWQDNSPGTNIMHGQWSNATLAMVNGRPQVIFPGGDGWLRAFEPESGKLLWKFDANPKDAKYELGGKGTKNDFIATPVVYENRLYIGVGQDPEHYEGIGHLWCIDLVKATQLGGDVSPVKNFDPKDPENQKKSAMVWHYGGNVPKEEIDRIRRDYYFGRLPPLPRRPHRTGPLGPRPQVCGLGFRLLRGRQGHDRHRGRRHLRLRPRQGKEAAGPQRDAPLRQEHPRRRQRRALRHDGDHPVRDRGQVTFVTGDCEWL